MHDWSVLSIHYIAIYICFSVMHSFMDMQIVLIATNELMFDIIPLISCWIIWFSYFSPSLSCVSVYLCDVGSITHFIALKDEWFWFMKQLLGTVFASHHVSPFLFLLYLQYWYTCEWHGHADLEGKTDNKIRALEAVEELRSKRADKQVSLSISLFLFPPFLLSLVH